MTSTQYLILGASLLATSMVRAGLDTHAEQMQSRVVRLAELHIDPSQLEKYKAALRDEIKTSIRLEPGVLTLYAVSVKGDPAQIRIFEIYQMGLPTRRTCRLRTSKNTRPAPRAW